MKFVINYIGNFILYTFKIFFIQIMKKITLSETASVGISVKASVSLHNQNLKGIFFMSFFALW